NAADVEAGAAEGLVLLDYGDLHAELRRADGADIAAGAGADHDEVVGHELLRTIRRYGRDRDRAIDRPRASPDPPKSPLPAPETSPPRGRRRGGGRSLARDTSSDESRLCRRPALVAPQSCACRG